MSIEYQLWQWVLLIPILILCSVKDIKRRKIPMVAVGAVIVIAITVLVFQESLSIVLILMRFIPGLILVVMHFVSRENIGLGDGWMMLMIGCVIGLESGMVIMFISFVFASIVSLYLLVRRKVKRNYQLPFAPFLLVSTLLGGVL